MWLDNKLFICAVVNANSCCVSNASTCDDVKPDIALGLITDICSVFNIAIPDVLISSIWFDNKVFICAVVNANSCCVSNALGLITDICSVVIVIITDDVKPVIPLELNAAICDDVNIAISDVFK